MDDWEAAYVAFALANQHLANRDARLSAIEGEAMQINRRIPVYSELQKLLDRPLTPDERNRVDKLMDSMGAPTR